MEERKNKLMETFIDEIKEEKRKEDVAIDDILNNSEFINKLIRKLINDTYVFENSENNEIKISLLYRIVDEYARSNSLSPIICNNYSIYYIDYNGYIFSVFKRKTDNEISYGSYVNYLKEDKLPYCIKFDDIRNHKVLNIDDYTRGLVVELKRLIDKLYQEGFPLHFIRELSGNIIDDLSSKSNQKTK